MSGRRETWGFALLVGAVLAVQVWIATAGTWSLAIDDLPFVYTTEIYARQAEAFAAGQAHLLLVPPAELARLPDPYDPAARLPFPVASDLSYYDGKYWLYFGPAPALFILLPQLLTGRPVADSVITLVSVLAATAFGAGSIRLLRRAILPKGGGVLAGAAIVALGLGTPLLFLLSSPAIHEAATAAGQAFLLAGLFFALLAANLSPGSLGPASQRPSLWALAGLCWALAMASRSALGPAVAALALLAGGAIWWAGRAGPVGRSATSLVALGAPLAVGVLLLGGYNAARFGSPFEFGHRYQLTSYHLLRDYAGFATVGHLAENVGNFFIRPLRISNEFPFVGWTPYPPWNATACSGAPDALIFGPIVGLLPAAPFVLLLAALPALVFLPAARRAALLAASLALAAGLAALPVLVQRWVTLRYEADFFPLLVLAAFAAASGLVAGVPGLSRLVAAVAILLAAAGATTGILLGSSGAFGHFARHNGPLWDSLQRLAPPLSVSRGAAPADPNLRVRFGETIEVAGTRFEPDSAGPGEVVTLQVWLRAPDGAAARLRLRERSGGIAFDEAVALAPTSELSEARLRFRLPVDYLRARPPDYLMADLAIADPRDPDRLLTAYDPAGGSPGEWVSAGRLRLAWPFAWPPIGASARELVFGNQFRLDGVCVAKVGLNGSSPAYLTVLLYWSALSSGSDRTLTLDLLDNTGRSVARVSGQPGDGLYRTSLWRPGEHFEDEWELGLPPLPPGEYRLRLSVNGLPARGDPLLARITIP
ncbi:MAG: hypothetical protein U0556_08210 [Dehalococcoidia bacterium]